MPMMRWDPFTALSRLDDEFDSVVRRTFGGSANQFVPPVEMATEGPDVVITLEVPGVDVSDIDIEVHEGRLTISGERSDRWEDSRGKLLVREVRYGAFRRTFQLPPNVTADQIEADADKGMLRLRIKNVTKPVAAPKKIAIRASGTTEPKTISGQAQEAKASDVKPETPAK